MDNNTPTVVKIHDVNIDKDYISWLEELKSRYRSAQIKAAVKVNAEKLRFNWELGRDLVIRKAEERWGSGVVEQVSLDLQAAFPESKGFSASNLWRMKQWYQFYCNEAGKLAQVARELQVHDYQNVRKLAQAITKDTYDFGFLTLEEGYKEEALETELEKHLTRFLLELGTGFAYLGRQKQIIIAGRPRKLDMLFYHIHLRCYIVIELKVTPFQPEYAGKLNYYVNAVNDLIKGPDDNPTIGLLICSNKDETDVQYAFQGIQTPMGVASYTNVQIKEIQDQLPSVEELTKRIRLLEEQLNKKNN